MRKLLLLSAVAITVLSFTSCKKRDYTCSCVESQGMNYNRDYEIGTVTNARAQTLCDNKQKDLAAHNITASCKVTF